MILEGYTNKNALAHRLALEFAHFSDRERKIHEEWMHLRKVQIDTLALAKSDYEAKIRKRKEDLEKEFKKAEELEEEILQRDRRSLAIEIGKQKREDSLNRLKLQVGIFFYNTLK